MLRFRKLLLRNELYYGIFLLSILFVILTVFHPKTSHYKEGDTEFTGRIIQIKEKEEKEYLYLKNKETVLGILTHSKEEYHLGDIIQVKGIFQKPSSSNNHILFDYQEYLQKQNIFYLIEIHSYKIIKKNHNLYYFLKQKILNHLHHHPYLHAFLLGDKTYINQEVKRSFSENGISHLFAISGMHISLLVSIIKKLFKKQSEERIIIITLIVLLFYLSLVGLSPSMVRGVLFYIIFTMNQYYYFYISKENLCLMILSIALFIKPTSIFDTGFLYSYSISFSLIRFSNEIKSNHPMISLLKCSILSSFVSTPITLYNYYQINLMSILYNLFFVPFVSTIVFPLTLIIFLYRPLEPIYNCMILILEKFSLFCSHISFGKMIFKRLPIEFYILYFLLILLFFIRKKKEYKILFIFILLIHYLIPYMSSTNYLRVIDVNQGDSLLLHQNHQNILIDTGGYNLFFSNIQPVLKADGVSKIHTLILSHGDYDHMGEAINLVNNFKVEKAIFNCGSYNDLEKELIKVLDKKHIKYYSCIKELNIDNNKLYFLPTKEYDNENDNSNVIYTELNGYKFMFMGDASVTTEKEILDKYNLPNIDVLKVGHHGSKTSSGKEFIDEIKPKYSIISVGKKNRYGHPNKEVLDNLKDSKIYRTDQDGSIMFKIKNNKLNIETCTP